MHVFLAETSLVATNCVSNSSTIVFPIYLVYLKTEANAITYTQLVDVCSVIAYLEVSIRALQPATSFLAMNCVCLEHQQIYGFPRLSRLLEGCL